MAKKKKEQAIAPAVVETTKVEQTQFLNWAEKGYGVQPLTLEMLERTQHENDTKGKPVQGIYHYALIQQILDMCANYGLEVEIYDMFAAQNRHKYMPGVSIIRQVEEQYGERAIEAHILRRIFCNMYIHNYDTPDMTTGLCIAFHQNGIQVGMGPNVKICHNQCMLNPQLYASTYGLKGEGRGTGLSVGQLLETIGGWLEDSSTLAKRDTELANAMLNTKVNKTAAIEMIGQLTAIRVKADSSNTLIRENIDYPLNQGQISAFAEDVLVQYKLKDSVNLWDIYNSGTLLFKAERMDIPQIMPQNRAFVKFLIGSMFFNDLQDKVSWNLTQDLVEYGVEVL